MTKGIAPHPPLTDYYDAPAKREEYVRDIFDETAPWYDWATWFLSFGYYWETTRDCVRPAMILDALRAAAFSDVERRRDVGIFSEYSGRK